MKGTGSTGFLVSHGAGSTWPRWLAAGCEGGLTVPTDMGSPCTFAHVGTEEGARRHGSMASPPWLRDHEGFVLGYKG